MSEDILARNEKIQAPANENSSEKVVPFRRARCKTGPKPKPVLSICMADVEREEVEWLWWPYIPFGKCTVIDGDPGQGKSFLCTEIAARLSQGQKLPGMNKKPQPVTTLMLAMEDGAGDTIRPRLDGCGADVGRIFLVKKDPRKPLRFDDVGLQTLKGEIERLGAKLVTIDPLNSYLPQDVRITDNAKMRQLIDCLALLAEQTGAAIVIVRHLNKGSGNAITRGAGVMDTIGGCRSALMVANDPEDEDRHIVALSKHNLTGRAPSLAFRIKEEGEFSWDGTSNLRADDLVAPQQSAEDRAALAEAIEFVKQELADGPVPTTILQQRAAKEKIADITLKRARDELGVVAKKAKKGEPYAPGWVCSLPEKKGDQTAAL